MIEFFTDIWRWLRGEIEDYGDPDYVPDYDPRDRDIRH